MVVGSSLVRKQGRESNNPVKSARDIGTAKQKAFAAIPNKVKAQVKVIRVCVQGSPPPKKKTGAPQPATTAQVVKVFFLVSL